MHNGTAIIAFGVGGAISLARRLSLSRASRFICKVIYLRILLEYVRVALTTHLGNPFVGHAAGA